MDFEGALTLRAIDDKLQQLLEQQGPDFMLLAQVKDLLWISVDRFWELERQGLIKIYGLNGDTSVQYIKLAELFSLMKPIKP